MYTCGISSPVSNSPNENSELRAWNGISAPFVINLNILLPIKNNILEWEETLETILCKLVILQMRKLDF